MDNTIKEQPLVMGFRWIFGEWWRALSIVVLLTFGLLAAYYPEMGDRTYISENALLPGHAKPTWGPNVPGHELGLSLAKDVSVNMTSGIGTNRWAVRDAFKNAGLAEVAVWSQGPGRDGWVVSAATRATRASGVEGIIVGGGASAPGCVGVVVGLARHLTVDSDWLGKDVLWVIVGVDGLDSRKSAGEAQLLFEPAGSQQLNQVFSEWVDDYHGMKGTGLSVGSLKGGIVLAGTSEWTPTTHWDSLAVRIEGAHGMLPNLDLVNIAWRLGKSFNFKVSPEPGPVWSPWWNSARAWIRQASGVPTGLHGPLLSYQVDSITLEPWNSGVASRGTYGGSNSITKLGKLTEALIRSNSNLLEHYHQSYFMYVLASSEIYVSVAFNVILSGPFWFVVAGRGLGLHVVGNRALQQQGFYVMALTLGACAMLMALQSMLDVTAWMAACAVVTLWLWLQGLPLMISLPGFRLPIKYPYPRPADVAGPTSQSGGAPWAGVAAAISSWTGALNAVVSLGSAPLGVFLTFPTLILTVFVTPVDKVHNNRSPIPAPIKALVALATCPFVIPLAVGDPRDVITQAWTAWNVWGAPAAVIATLVYLPAWIATVWTAFFLPRILATNALKPKTKNE